MIRLAVLAALLAIPAAAQDLRFSPDATVECLDSGNPEGDCIGASANLCMERTQGGYSTAGMNACLDRELGYWDARLNAAYGPLMARHRREDAEMGMPEDQRLATTLRAMQRAWIAFRDATCAYERAFWAGGTGAGPATLSCLLRLTGTQALYLERMAEPR